MMQTSFLRWSSTLCNRKGASQRWFIHVDQKWIEAATRRLHTHIHNETSEGSPHQVIIIVCVIKAR